jgi:hypothetical protein
MNEEPMPGASSADQELNRRWREQSAEEPSSLLDARIRAAARQAIAGFASKADAVPGRSRWTRFLPLAAAASVALLAVGIVRMIPRGAYEAMPVPGPGPAQPSARETTPTSAPPPASRGEPEAERGRDEPATLVPPEADLRTPRFATAPPDAGVQAPQFASESPSREQAGLTPQPAPTTKPERHRADEAAAPRPATADAVDANAAVEPTDRHAKASEAQITTTTSRATQSAPETAALEGARRPPDAVVPEFPETLATQLRIDAARRAGADPAAIRIVAVEPTAWLDSSLGCGPQREVSGEPRVAGYVVTVEAPGTTLRYHTDDRDRIAVCEDE